MKNQTLQYKKTFLISVYTCKLNILLTTCAHVYFLGLLLATLHHVFCTLGSGIMWLQQFLFKNYFMHKNWDDCKHFSKIRKEIKKKHLTVFKCFASSIILERKATYLTHITPPSPSFLFFLVVDPFLFSGGLWSLPVTNLKNTKTVKNKKADYIEPLSFCNQTSFHSFANVTHHLEKAVIYSGSPSSSGQRGPSSLSAVSLRVALT